MSKTTKNKIGRPRRSFSYEEASQIAQSECISTAEEYFKWWNYNLPARMPKRPDCAYKNQNFKWSKFLGTNNTFPSKRVSTRTYEEARQFASTLGLKNRTEWFMFSKSGKRPIDIPARPDYVYVENKTWVSWKDFLGVNIANKHEMLVAANRLILYIVKLPNRPNNVYKFGTTYQKKDYLTDLESKGKLQIIRLYYLIDNSFDWINFVEKYANEYLYGEDNEYVLSNIGALISDIAPFTDII